jgi:hypothetical protein
MKRYEIAKELDVGHSTVTRDIKYLTQQSQSYLNDLAKETMPFMYQTSIEGIRDILKQCWAIYQSEDKSINWFHRIAATGCSFHLAQSTNSKPVLWEQ